MYKRLILIFALVLFLSFSQSIFASVRIIEIQIEEEASKDSEYIKIYNNSSNEIDLTNWSIYKKTSGGTESSFVSKSRFDGKKIPSNGFLFLAREGKYLGNEKVDIFWPTSYSLAFNNSLILYKDFDNKIISDSVSWGEVSLFKAGESSEENEETVEENINTSVANTGSVKQDLLDKKATEKLQINYPKIGFTGIPISFEAIILNEEYKNIYGKFLWNFGDGNFKEFKSIENNKFSYTYFYPGKYNLFLEYYKNNFEEKAFLSTEIIIEIIEPSIIISNTGEENNFFIELENKSKNDINLTNFILSGENKIFIFPKNTFLKKENKIILSPHITNFNFSDKNFLELKNETGKIIFSNKILENKKIQSVSTNKLSAQTSLQKIITTDENLNEEEILESYDLVDNQALVLDSDLGKNLSYNNFYFLGVLILITLGIVFVFFIRKNNTDENREGDNFEILDE